MGAAKPEPITHADIYPTLRTASGYGKPGKGLSVSLDMLQIRIDNLPGNQVKNISQIIPDSLILAIRNKLGIARK